MFSWKKRNVASLPQAKPLVVLLLAVLTLSSCALLPAGQARTDTSQNEPTPTPVPTPVVATKPTYKVERGEVVRELQLSGRIAPVKEQELFFKVAGRVRSIKVKKGDMVTTGQVLADLEIADLERELAGSQLDLQRAQVRLEAAKADLQENIKKAELNLKVAQENLAITQGQDPAPRKTQAEAELRKAQITLEQAQAAYDAIAWRNDRGASAEAAALEQATLAFNEAKASFDLAMQGISTQGHQVEIARQQVELAQLTLDSLNRGVDPLLENDVQRAELAAQKLEASISDAQLIAPFDGEVLDESMTEGRPIDAYKPSLTVADPSALEVRIDATNVLMTDLAEGMPATVGLVGRPGSEIKATVTHLPALYSTTTTSADEQKYMSLTLEPGSTGYELGDVARVRIVLERKPDVLWLPPQAIRTFEGRRFVVIQEDAAQRRVDVKIGIEGEDRVEIESGVTEGQIVMGQ